MPKGFFRSSNNISKPRTSRFDSHRRKVETGEILFSPVFHFISKISGNFGDLHPITKKHGRIFQWILTGNGWHSGSFRARRNVGIRANWGIQQRSLRLFVGLRRQNTLLRNDGRWPAFTVAPNRVFTSGNAFGLWPRGKAPQPKTLIENRAEIMPLLMLATPTGSGFRLTLVNPEQPASLSQRQKR